MAVLRVAHVWGDRLLDVRHLAGEGTVGPLTLAGGQLRLDGASVQVAPGKPTRVELGPTSFVLEYVEPPARVSANATKDADWHFAKVLSCLLLLSAALVAMFVLDVRLGFVDADEPMGRMPPLIVRHIAHAPPKLPKVIEAAAAPRPEGTAGTRDARKTDAAAPKREAKTAGLLGAFEALGEAKALFAGGGLSEGLNNALGNLKGPAVGDARGLGGMGPRGFGPGGGGLDGPGGFGLNPRPGGIPGGLTKKVDVGPCCSETKVSDGLSKDVIARVIRRHFNEIKFCYEQVLQQKSELSGKVVVLFVIDGAGAVSDANVAESTMDDANVESCILSRVRRWKFPEPRGGGIVSVTHPWLFKPAGSGD